MRLTRNIPLLALARSYRRSDFPHDAVAGLVLGVVTVPQAIAYAFLAGLPAEAGLYASLVPMVIYAALGSSRQLVVGPVAIAALMVAATVGEFAPAHSHQYLAITTVLSLQVGLFLLLLRLARLGGVVNLLSHPVIAGFINAAAILIIVSQIGAFAGLESTSDGNVLARLVFLIASLQELNGVAIAVGAGSLAVLWLVRRYAPPLLRLGREHPLGRTGPLLVAVVATLAVLLWELPVATVGFVPAGLPPLTVPSFDAALWWDLLPHAALIALVAYVESFSVGKTLAAKRQLHLDGNQELLALGAANVGAALCGAYPVAGSFTRSSVNEAAGGRTQLSILVCAAAILATLLWLTPLFRDLPHAALAAIIMASVWGLLDFGSLRQRWRFHRADVIAHFATLFGVLAIGVEGGLLLGLAVSLALFLRRSSDPHIAVVGRLAGSPHFRNVERYEVQTWPHILAVRVDESIYFANADQIETRLFELIEPVRSTESEREDTVRHLLLVMSAVNFVDASGLEMLQRLNARLDGRGLALHLCEVKGPVRDQLEHADLGAWLGGEIHRTTDDACNALAGNAGAWVWVREDDAGAASGESGDSGDNSDQCPPRM